MARVGDHERVDEPAVGGDFAESPRAARPAERPGLRPRDEPPPTGGSLWGIAEVSAYLRVPRSAIYKMTARTAIVRIPHIRLGRRLRFRSQDIDAWLSRLATSQPDALQRIRRKALKVTYGHDP
jgi:excisionase family DNA binding protein